MGDWPRLTPSTQSEYLSDSRLSKKHLRLQLICDKTKRKFGKDDEKWEKIIRLALQKSSTVLWDRSSKSEERRKRAETEILDDLRCSDKRKRRT